MYKVYIDPLIVTEQMKTKYGDDYKLEIDVAYQAMCGNTKIDIIFTKDTKALWIAKYKGEFYMSIIDEIELDDKYRVIDIYTTLSENAQATLKALKPQKATKS